MEVARALSLLLYVMMMYAGGEGDSFAFSRCSAVASAAARVRSV